MKSTSALLLGIALINVPAFAAPDLSKLPPASDKTGLTYAKDIRPILEASCFRCHGEERQRGGLRLDTLEGVMKGSEDGKILTPGKSRESSLLLSVAQIDDETAMPPKRGGGGGPGGQRGPGGPGGFGGPGGRGGFGPGGMLAPQMVTQGDKDGDKKLSKEEFATLADAWFDKLDTDKSGKLSQEQFVARIASVLPAPQGGRGGGFGGGGKGPGDQPRGGPQAGGQPGQPGQPGGGRGGFGPGRFIGPGFFAATDTDKDGSLTRAEFKATFAKWFGEWDADKSGAIDEAKISSGLSAALPRPNFGGPGGPGQAAGGPGGPGGNRPPGQGGPGGGFGGQQSKPLTAEQVGLVRAWIDQGAK